MKELEITINGVELQEWLKANKEKRAIIFAIVAESDNKNKHHSRVGMCGTKDNLLTVANDLVENEAISKWIAAACVNKMTGDLIEAITANDDEDADDTETPAEKPEENNKQ